MRRIKNIFSISPEKNRIPRHVIVNPFYSKKSESANYINSLKVVGEIIRTQIRLKIPIVTIKLLSKNYSDENVRSLSDFFYKIDRISLFDDNKIKVSVLGKWYDLPGKAVSPIKELIENTKDYDNYFLNFCIDYDPHEEITDSAKIIARKIEVKKLNLESVDSQEFKDNLSSSYFLPADLIIEAGRKFSGTLLWDSVGAEIYFAKNKEFGIKEFLKGIRQWQMNREIFS